MAQKKPAKKRTQKSDRSTTATGEASKGVTPEERVAMRERALDEGPMWPTSYALTNLTAADEARISALVRKAVS